MANAFDRFDTETAPRAKAGNPFDAFDEQSAGNPFDAFDEAGDTANSEQYGPSYSSNAGRSFPRAEMRAESQAKQPEQNYDSFVEATGKSLDNVPERLQQSFGGLVQMLGEDMGQERERHMNLSAQRLGISPNEYKLLAWAGNEGLVDPETPVPDALESLKARLSTELTPEQQAQVADMGIINPDQLAEKGKELRADAQSTMEPVNAEPGSAAYYTSAAIGSIAEMTPALLASVLTRNPATGMSIIGGQVGGDAYGRARDAGKSVDESQTYAMAQAAAEAIPEYLPISTILKPGAKFLGKMAKTGAAESLQEMITAALQAGIDKEIIQPDMTWGEARQQIIDGGIIGLIAGPGMAAMMEPVIRLQDRSKPTQDDSTPPVAENEMPAEPSPVESGAGTNPFDAFDETESEAPPASVEPVAADTVEPQPTQRESTADVAAAEPVAGVPEIEARQEREPTINPLDQGETLPDEQATVDDGAPDAALTPEPLAAAEQEVEAASMPQEGVDTVVSTPTSRKVDQAAADTDINPTEAQKEAGNYRKAKVRIQGLEIAIENPKGSTRSGTDPNGKRWESTMAHHYGDIKGTKAADGDNLDVFIGPYPEIDQVFVIDQPNADGSFDEHKILLGYANEKEAREGYLANYEKGWKVGPITRMSMDEFKAWVRDGDTTAPIAMESPKPMQKGKVAQQAPTPDQEKLAEVFRQLGRENPRLEYGAIGYRNNGMMSRVRQATGREIYGPELKRIFPQEQREAAYKEGQAESLQQQSGEATTRQAKREQETETEFSREGEFRRTPEYQQDALTTQEAESIRDELMSGWKGAPDVIIRDQIDQFPPGLQAAIRLAGAENDMRGVFWNDTVYILASRIPDRMRMEQVILHEVIGHYGLRKMLGKDMDRVLNQIWMAHGGQKRADFIIKRYFPGNTFDVNNKEHRHTVAEELIAHLAEQSRGQTLVQRAVAIIREGLRKLGFTIEFTVDDIVNLLRKARATVENGGFETTESFAGNESPASRFSRTDSADDGIPVLNQAPTDEIPVLQPEGPGQNPETAYDRAFKSLGDKDKTVFARAKRLLRRELTPGGLLPGSVFKAKLERDFKLNGLEFDIANRLGHFDDAVQRAYGKPFNKLPESEVSKINQALGGDDVFLTLPEPIRLELHKMRLVIKNLSRQYARHLASEIEQLQAQGSDAAAAAKIQLLETIINNLDTYVHRSYRAFDDPNWPRKVTREVYDAAARYLEQRYKEQPGISQAQIQDKVSKTLELILEEGTAFDSIEGFIKESKLGAKDLSVLQRRKQVAPEIRALLGEYTDPKVNFSKSVTKMARLIMNQRFLDKVRDLGLAEGFLFEKENRQLDATRQIAADASEVYAPLNGLYTYPEVEQAFKDALGKEQMADWFRTIVRLNGMVKYGKTVLSPTTAARNWMSASFFAMANGHFDFSQMTKSVQSVREYFTHGEGKDGYLRKMKQLGVIYDTPYAGEMMDLLADSQLENDLFGKRPFTNLRRFNEIAQKFYQYGDDFWKILGFENEKALLIKHKGLTEKQAETEAAERIRNTYPTYSMTGRFVQRLRRFPLAGTFVSFPAEIVRTSYHILRYAGQDLRQTPSLGRRKLAGLAIASGMIHALQGVAMALVGMDDDEEEAFRDLAAPWMENSNLLPLGRNEKGQIRLIDMSFLDPYNYFKRPVNALLRDQPLDDAIKSAAVDLWSPFFGQDIAFGAISEALSNQKESGGRVFNPHAPVTDQAVDIANHMRKALQPGIAANLERIVKASRGEISASGRPYSLKDEGAALVGFRITTFDPKASIYYKAFEFQDKKRDATSILSSVAKNPNEISDSALRDAYITAEKTRTEAYEDMIQLIKAGMNAGLTRLQIAASLRNSGVSKSDTSALVRGVVPPWKPSSQMMRGAIKKAQVLFDDETAQEFNRRRGIIQEAFQESLRKSRQNQQAQ